MAAAADVSGGSPAPDISKESPHVADVNMPGATEAKDPVGTPALASPFTPAGGDGTGPTPPGPKSPDLGGWWGGTRTPDPEPGLGPGPGTGTGPSPPLPGPGPKNPFEVHAESASRSPEWEDTADDYTVRDVPVMTPHARDPQYLAKLRLLLLLLDRGAGGGALPLEAVKKLNLHAIMGSDVEYALGLLLVNAVGKEAARKLQPLDTLLQVHVDSYPQNEVDDYYRDQLGRVCGNIRGFGYYG